MSDSTASPLRGPLLKWLGSLAVLGLLRVTRHLPLSWLRALGAVLGWLLYAVVGRRRRIAEINVKLCFPHWSDEERRQAVRRHFVLFAQAWLIFGRLHPRCWAYSP